MVAILEEYKCSLAASVRKVSETLLVWHWYEAEKDVADAMFALCQFSMDIRPDADDEGNASDPFSVCSAANSSTTNVTVNANDAVKLVVAERLRL